MLVKGDRVTIVGLSSKILGELGCKHQVEFGIKRLKDFLDEVPPKYIQRYIEFNWIV